MFYIVMSGFFVLIFTCRERYCLTFASKHCQRTGCPKSDKESDTAPATLCMGLIILKVTRSQLQSLDYYPESDKESDTMPGALPGTLHIS